MNFVRILDFETTGTDPATDCIIEAGWIDCFADGSLGDPMQTFVRPTCPISIESRAVHHIADEEAEIGIPLDMLKGLLLDNNPVAFVAHNSKFEESFLDCLTPPWIDTYRCALRLWPEAPRHTNQVLRYWLGLELDPALAMPPHRAAPDAFVTAHIFARMLAEEGEYRLKRLLAWSKEPGLLPKLLFGKHRGMRFSEAPADYLGWITKQADMDEDVRFTAWKELTRREFG